MLENKKEVEEVETKNNNLEGEKEKFSADLAAIRKVLDSQKARERELEDNVRLVC